MTATEESEMSTEPSYALGNIKDPKTVKGLANVLHKNAHKKILITGFDL